VTSLGSALREKRASRRPLATRATVRLLRMSTMVAKKLQDMPIPPPVAGERLALEMAASQLRAMVGAMPVPAEAVSDPDAPEAALVELVGETLALVDRLLARAPEVGGTKEKKAPELEEGPTSQGATRVRF